LQQDQFKLSTLELRYRLALTGGGVNKISARVHGQRTEHTEAHIIAAHTAALKDKDKDSDSQKETDAGLAVGAQGR
jgi:hypothetical protein